MKKINKHVLSLPPYISTPWSNISSIQQIHKEGKDLLQVTLGDGSHILIPNLDEATTHEIFEAHAQYLESASSGEGDIIRDLGKNSFSFGIPLQMGAEGPEAIAGMMQHNSEQSGAPPIPPHVLEKISMIAKSMGLHKDMEGFSPPEPHCNCPYCQIARALFDEEEVVAEQAPEEEPVSVEDLSFRDWEIKEISAKLYDVLNPLNQNEHYQVFLGKPIGCTCGQKNCEHIRAVLNS